MKPLIWLQNAVTSRASRVAAPHLGHMLRHASTCVFLPPMLTRSGPGNSTVERNEQYEHRRGRNRSVEDDRPTRRPRCRGLMRHSQCIVDDMKYDVRDEDEEHLAVYANEYVAFGRVLEGKYSRSNAIGVGPGPRSGGSLQPRLAMETRSISRRVHERVRGVRPSP